MLDAQCLFCKIIQKTIPSTVIAENEHVIVIKDIAPRAPTHLLIIPKHHVENVSTMTTSDAVYSSALFSMAQELGKTLSHSAFNLIVNNGAAAGQSVFHLHMHFLAGRNIYDSGIRL